MNSLDIVGLLNLVRAYEPDQVKVVEKAYNFADFLHSGQKRQSGEPYIIHPLNVASILAEMHADIDTVCAGLLHDTLEDTNITKDEIIKEFNGDVASLVDGVTKISKMNFSSRFDEDLANTRKIITSITTDVRIIIIKLADRLHNMRTLQYKSETKQKENALETLEIFVPLAYYIGAYRIKRELEDLSFRYLKPDDYKYIKEQKLKIEQENMIYLKQMKDIIKKLLDEHEIENWIKIEFKNLYGIYKKLNEGEKLEKMHDLLALKISVDNYENCYRALGFIHSKYHPINSQFKDYICNPKNNMYQSLHTTVFGENERLVQAQIRDYNMDRVASFGLATYWNIKGCNAREKMQQELKEKYQFFKSLIEIDSAFGDNQDFLAQAKAEVLSNGIYVYTKSGNIIELPKGATPIDFAYRIGDEEGNYLVGAIVNDQPVPLNYQLQSKDIVKIISNNLSPGPKSEWLDIAQTTTAKKKIKQCLGQ